MPVNADDVAEVRRRMEMPTDGGYSLQALDSPEAILAYCALDARNAGESEADLIEVIIRAVAPGPDEVRREAGLLHQLGYIKVAAMMRSIARAQEARSQAAVASPRCAG